MAKTKDQVKAARKNRRTKNKAENAKLKQSKNWYPVTDEKKRFKRKCKLPKSAKLRSSITPGTVLILLSGRFRGRRVIFLKQLKSGLLLVTGPYKFNGVPLKRVNQAYVIATRTKVTLGNIPQLDKIEDGFFKKVPIKRTDLGEVILPKDEAEKRLRITEDRKTFQSNVDTEVKKAIGNTPYLKDYLRNRFALKSGQQAHNLVF
jgi:large subunit ribosomal protein L6e